MLEPLPTGAWAFLSVTTAVVTKILPFQAAFAAFHNDVIWLIVVSFFFAAVCPSLAGWLAGWLAYFVHLVQCMREA